MTVRGAVLAPSFKHALVISSINRRALEILGKNYRYLSHSDISLRMVEAVARHKKHPAESLFRTMEFSYEEPFHYERIEEILFMH